MRRERAVPQWLLRVRALYSMKILELESTLPTSTSVKSPLNSQETALILSLVDGRQSGDWGGL
jgi:hypothetical protein